MIRKIILAFGARRDLLAQKTRVLLNKMGTFTGSAVM